VTATLTKELCNKSEYEALFIPPIFHRGIISAAAEAVMREDFDDHPNMIGYASFAISLASKFLDCAHVDLAPEECNDEGPVNYVLFLEYEKEYFGAMLKEVDFYLRTFPPRRDMLCMECRERYREACLYLQACSYIHGSS
jgi:hypothetical protein